MFHKSEVAVLGLEYLRRVTAACSANFGHRVTGVDRDGRNMRDVLDGPAPLYESELKLIVRQKLEAVGLAATSSASEAAEKIVASRLPVLGLAGARLGVAGPALASRA